MGITQEKIEELYHEITTRKKIIAVGHVNPDGDSVGSLCGLKNFLKENNIDCKALVPSKYPDFLSFLDPEGEILSHRENVEEVERIVKEADLIICMDFNALSRIEDLGAAIGSSKAKKILIDHHLSPDASFDIIFSDITVSSTCELLYYILKELANSFPLKPISKVSGTPLYTGMMTDTNNFANSVRPQTFKMAYELLELGIEKEKIQFSVFSGFSCDRMRLMGYMLHENMKILPKINGGIMVLTKEIKDKFNFSDGDSEGFVNLALNVKGVMVSALFTESIGFVRVSLRSKDGFSVNKLARMFFNGGGHEKAAGGKLFIPISEVEEYFVKAVEKYLEENQD